MFGFGEKTSAPAVHAAAAPRKAEPVTVVPRTVNGDDRYDRLKDWLRQNEVALAERALSDDDRLSHHPLAAYPASKGGCLARGIGCFPGGNPKAPVYVLGDTHGDFDTLFAILESIFELVKENGEANPTIYLLGDVVDRNGEGCMLECALLLAILQKALPEEFAKFNDIRLGIVKGDHDVGLIYPEPYSPDTRFKAMVSPADYCDWLNQRIEDGGGEDVTKIGRAWIRLMKECPAAVFLEEPGTLLAHGGVPREDLQRRVAAGEPYMLQSEAFAQDFAWCRMVDMKKKLLNRGSKTSEVGGQEFDSFCKIVFPKQSQDGREGTCVRRFVFGHQHPVKGFEQYTKFYDGYEAVCIASFRSDDVFGGPTMPHFCRLQPDVTSIAFDELAEKNVEKHTPEKFEVFRLELSFAKEMEPARPDVSDAKETEPARPDVSDAKPDAEVAASGSAAARCQELSAKYGEETVVEALGKLDEKLADEAINAVLEAAGSFLGMESPMDDVAMPHGRK